VTKGGASWALAVLIFVVGIPFAQAHEVLHTIERGRAIAVKAYFADGEALAYTEYQVFSPTDARIPYQKGRTDRSGYLAFVPDAPGAWRVKVADATGHGLDLVVDVASTDGESKRPATPVAAWVFALRPILGVALVGGLFALLVLLYRRRGSGK
jgi:nickel transport protein